MIIGIFQNMWLQWKLLECETYQPNKDSGDEKLAYKIEVPDNHQICNGNFSHNPSEEQRTLSLLWNKFDEINHLTQ